MAYKIISLLVLAIMIFIAFEATTESKNKAKASVIGIAVIGMSFFLAYMLMTSKFFQKIAEYIVIGYAGVMLGGFVIGHIVGIFSKGGMNRIAEIWAGLRVAIFFVVPIGVAALVLSAWI